METERFVALMRRLRGTEATRRAAGRRLAGLGLGAIFLRHTGIEESAAACAGVGKPCSQERRCCAGAGCSRGRCACKKGFTRCGTRCVDVDRDPKHWGSCGFACPKGAICAAPFCVRAVGRSGSGPRQFDTPTGIAAKGRTIAVSEVGNHRIQLLKPGGETIVFGGRGSRDGQFESPTAADGTMFVADCVNHRIQKFDPRGESLLVWGEFGSGQEQFNLPRGLAVDRNANVWVADTFNHRIQRFNQNGFFLDRFGREGSGSGQFSTPEAIAVDDQRGLVFVADSGNDRIQVLDRDGGFIRAFGRAGSGDGEFDRPRGIAVSDRGTVFVTDSQNNRVQAFGQDGRFFGSFGGPSTNGRLGALDFPGGIAVDETGAIHVADSGRDRIATFVPVPTE